MRIRAKANRNIVDVDEQQARAFVDAGIFEYVDEPAAPTAPPPPPDPNPNLAQEASAVPGEPDFDLKTKAELEVLAEGMEIKGTGKDGFVLKADLVRALSGRYGRRDMRAEP